MLSACTRYASKGRSWHLLQRRSVTKQAMQRMKKDDLVQLAKNRHVDSSGTKHEIIRRLQQAKESSRSRSSEEADMSWVNAFDTKVAQRGIRRPTETTRALPRKQPRPSSRSAAQPFVSHKKESSGTSQPSITPDDVNHTWVEAFDRKVMHRGARRERYVDTLTINPTTEASTPLASDPLEETSTSPDDISAVAQTILKNTPIETSPRPSVAPILERSLSSNLPASDSASASASASSSSNSSRSPNDSKPSSRPVLHTAIGSALAVWVFFGEHGFKTIINFVS